MENIQTIAGEILTLASGEHADEIKARVSELVQEAQHLSNAFALALASNPKGDSTSPAPTPPPLDAGKEAAPVSPLVAAEKNVEAVVVGFVRNLVHRY